MFTALFVTRLVFDFFTYGRVVKSIPMLQFVKNPHFDFVSKRKFAYIFSACAITLGLVCLVMRGEKNLGVDFSGGTVQEFRFTQPVDADAVRAALKKLT